MSEGEFLTQLALLAKICNDHLHGAIATRLSDDLEKPVYPPKVERFLIDVEARIARLRGLLREPSE